VGGKKKGGGKFSKGDAKIGEETQRRRKGNRNTEGRTLTPEKKKKAENCESRARGRERRTISHPRRWEGRRDCGRCGVSAATNYRA